jgi:hypothetical protein
MLAAKNYANAYADLKLRKKKFGKENYYIEAEKATPQH